jgi:hypothetical protein
MNTFAIRAAMVNALDRPLVRRYSYLVTELSRGTVFLGHVSKHGLMIALALTFFMVVLAQTARCIGTHSIAQHNIAKC